MNWDRKWLVGFSAGKKLKSFHLTGLVLLMLKWIGLLLKKNLILRCWNGLSLLNWIGALILSLNLLNLPPRKLEP